MTTWIVSVELLYRGEPWPEKKITLWSTWSDILGKSLRSDKEWTDSDGCATFEIEDKYDELDGDTNICFTVKLNGQKYDFGPFELGDEDFTINVDPDDDPDEVTAREMYRR